MKLLTALGLLLLSMVAIAQWEPEDPTIKATYKEFWDRVQYDAGWPKKGWWSVAYSVSCNVQISCKGATKSSWSPVVGGPGNMQDGDTKFPGYQFMQREVWKLDKPGVDDKPVQCRRYYVLYVVMQKEGGPERVMRQVATTFTTPVYLDPDK